MHREQVALTEVFTPYASPATLPPWISRHNTRKVSSDEHPPYGRPRQAQHARHPCCLGDQERWPVYSGPSGLGAKGEEVAYVDPIHRTLCPARSLSDTNPRGPLTVSSPI